jgi:hypothetical protein
MKRGRMSDDLFHGPLKQEKMDKAKGAVEDWINQHMARIAQPVRSRQYYEFHLERLPYFLWSVAVVFVMTLLIKLTTELILG